MEKQFYISYIFHRLKSFSKHVAQDSFNGCDDSVGFLIFEISLGLSGLSIWEEKVKRLSFAHELLSASPSKIETRFKEEERKTISCFKAA